MHVVLLPQASAVAKGARQVAAALLAEVLATQEACDTAQAEAATLKHLLALHALSLADPTLCVPPRDPAKFVRSLAPYLIAPDQVRWSAGRWECVRRMYVIAVLPAGPLW